jgi:N-acetylglucosaminyldiphosphoundecaprenol N-acetyl-beta-D-mannosaminyltransferase
VNRQADDETPTEPRVAVLLGVPVDDITLPEAVTTVEQMVATGRSIGRTHQVATVNVDFIVNCLGDPTLRRLLQDAELCIPDGMPIVWGSKLLGMPIRERVTGADLVPALARRSAFTAHRILFFGSAPGVAEHAAELMRELHGANVVGMSGPRVDGLGEMDPSALDAIRAERPDIICVALGNPKQERWIARHRAQLGIPVLIGVGGTFDLMVGAKRRAPAWMQRSGTEWVFRMLQEPQRLARRYGRDLRLFAPHLLGQMWAGRHRRQRWSPPPVTISDCAVNVTIDATAATTFDNHAVSVLAGIRRQARRAGGDLELATTASGDAALARLGLQGFFRPIVDIADI